VETYIALCEQVRMLEQTRLTDDSQMLTACAIGTSNNALCLALSFEKVLNNRASALGIIWYSIGSN
jgi:hypothetical protein